MIKNVQEGVKRYKSAVMKFKKWSDGRTRHYDALYGKGNWTPEENFSDREQVKVHQSYWRICAMMEILGMNNEEAAAIDNELGM